jgi:hypothetical protein
VNTRLKGLGAMLAIIGLAFIAGGGFAYYKTDQGARSLQAFSAAQNVTLSYNEAGQLVDRGKTEGAQAIMSLLTNDWGYAINTADFNPNDPLVNTASEYMYQMATIAHHTLTGTTTVVLDKDVTAADGTVTKAGTYEFATDGRYWTGFDRTDPIQAVARDQVWSGTTHALIAELGVGSVTASARPRTPRSPHRRPRRTARPRRARRPRRPSGTRSRTADGLPPSAAVSARPATRVTHR